MSLSVGDRVQGGKRGTEDFDTGTIHEKRKGEALVSWDSGVRTWTPLRLLKRERSNPHMKRAKKQTKLQRMNAASRKSKQRRVATALRKFVDAALGKGKEAVAKKNPGGKSITITVLKPHSTNPHGRRRR